VTEDEKKFLSLMEGKRKDVDKKVQDLKKQQKELEDKNQDYLQLKKNAGVLQKKSAALDKQVTVKETAIEQLRNIKDQLLKRSKLEQVEIPLKKQKKGKSQTKRKRVGEEKKEGKEGKGKKKRKAVASSEESSQEEKETEMNGDAETEIDFDSLDPKKTEVKTAAQYDQIKAEFEAELEKMRIDIEKLAPNLKAVDHFQEVKERLQTTKDDWDSKKKDSQKAAELFESIKKERFERFKKAFDHVAKEIDPIYKGLTQSSVFPVGGKAYLHLENNEEPYNFGIKYTAMPPMKRFRDMTELSGGEQTIAALALLFAIHSYHPAPFFVLDEVDAALDNANVGKVSAYIRQRSRQDKLQCIVISLKDTFYTKADALVGVYKDQKQQQSGILTLALTEHD